MTIKQALKKYHKIEIELLLSHVLGKPKEFLFINNDHRLTATQMAQITQMAKRRLKGEPMAYILGYKDFYGLRFKVNRSVLIPRPETEWFVERALRAKGLGLRGKIRILDVGTGSGCIIISLAKSLPTSRCTLYASDVSPAALKVAKANAKKFGAKIKFVQSDLLEKISGKFDVIIGNLPYVASADYKTLRQDLKYEPKLALVGSRGLYQDFFKQAGHNLHPWSVIYLEMDPRAENDIKLWTKKYLPGFSAKTYKDFRHLWRYAEIQVFG